ncbi:MAG: ABC transporter permease [Clostridia bacterium]
MINILIKDLKLIFADKKALAILILMPVILTSILGFALRGSFSEAGSEWTANIGIVKEYEKETEILKATSNLNEIYSDYGQDIELDFSQFDPEDVFFNQFLGEKEISNSINYKIMSIEKAERELKDKTISSIVIVPKDFIYDMYINFYSPFRNNIKFKIVGHPDSSYTNRIVEGFINGFSDTISSMIISKNILLEKGVEYLGQSDTINLIEELDFTSLRKDELVISTNQLSKKNTVTSLMYYSAAMLAMFVFFSAGYAGKYMLHEKEYQTFDRLLTTKNKVTLMISSKFIITMLIVILQSLIMIVYSTTVFGISWGNLFYTLLTVLSSSIVVSSVGLFIIALTLKHNSYKVYDAFTSFIIQVFALFGGSYIPIEVLPKYFSYVSNVVPNGVILNSYIKTFEGTTLAILLPNYITLIVTSLIFSIIGIFILRKEELKNA